MANKMVYFFGEGKGDMKDLLGGKGAYLNEMTNLGIRVPPGFTITTEMCAKYYDDGKKWPKGLKEDIAANLKRLETTLGKKFGDQSNPLLVSVRSGAKASMPGMMDTILNLGLNDVIMEGLIKKTKNDRFALDSYRRFLTMFGDVVMKVKHERFEKILDDVKNTKGVKYDLELDASDLRKVITRYKELIKKDSGKDFPQDPMTQLMMAIDAVFESWNNNRAIAYRQLNNIKGLLGTAVNIQAMVFGNTGDKSGTGVFFTRDPSTGEHKLYGEYLINAQGEDVVAGIRTPQKIETLKDVNKKVYNELVDVYTKLELHAKDMLDMEFTVEDNVLYILQARVGKRTAQAAVKIAMDMLDEKLIDKKTAVLRVMPEQLNQLMHKQLDPVAKKNATVLAKGLPASPGAAVGSIVFTAQKAEEMAKEGHKVVLVRLETSPEDIKGMAVAQGILTCRGGMTSHAAVVARGMGKCCVSGCDDIIVDDHAKTMHIGKQKFKEGDFITLDGNTGEVIEGKVTLIDPILSGDFNRILKIADEFRKIGVRTNADTPYDSKVARDFGAEGIGLTRTEHMFFEGDRIKAVREMILAENVVGRKKALAKLEPMQKQDFVGIFEAMKGLHVTIRLLDPPLHEFLPQKDDEKEIKYLAKELNVTTEHLKDLILSLHELNPMLGHRGCRLGITYPELIEMQTRAIIEAAIEVKKEGFDVYPEIMVPLVGHINEFTFTKAIIKKVADDCLKKAKMDIKYMIGTMIEIPRAALTAQEIAKEAEFFSFGTNDLTQMTFGFSRDDIGKFLPEYLEKNVLEKDPFISIDRIGVGRLIKLAVEEGRVGRKNLKVGICGEHGGDPSSIEFCHKIGMDYVSCSPFRVPIARLAAAHAAINDEKK